MTPAEIDALIRLPKEGHHLEFKEAKTTFDFDKLKRYCVAIANEGGGRMLLGVTDKRPRLVVGTTAFTDLGILESRLRVGLGFRVEPEEIAHDGGRVLVLHIPSRPVGTAYQCEGAYLMRSGEELVPMTEDRLRAIFAEGQPSWLEQAATEPMEAHIVLARLDWEGFFRLMGIPAPSSAEAILDRLDERGMLHAEGTQWRVTRLGALLLARDLRSFGTLARRIPRIIAYEGKGKLVGKPEEDFFAGYAVGFERMIAQIHAYIGSKEHIGADLRIIQSIYPDRAIREFLANALIHQDFQVEGSTVKVEVFADRIEVTNPGLPFVPVDRFVDEDACRNEPMAEAMRRLGICERKGSGIDRALEVVEAKLLPSPDFRGGSRSTVSVLLGPKPFADMLRNERVRACYHHACLLHQNGEQLSNQSLRLRFGLPEQRSDAVSRVIREALEQGRILPADPENTSNRYARYVPYWA